MTTDLTPRSRVEREEAAPKTVALGEWYWLPVRDDESGKSVTQVLVCVTHIGSNFVKVSAPRDSKRSVAREWRIHFDEFDALLKREPNANDIIRRHVDAHRGEVNRLMGRVRELTASLSLSTRGLLSRMGHGA